MSTAVVTTTSGTCYVLSCRGADWRVTRYGRTAVIGYDDPIAGEPIVEYRRPTVGAPWRFATAAGPFTTTPVVRVVWR